MKITDLDLPARIKNALGKTDITTVAQLKKYEPNDLLTVPGIGESAAEKILEVLADLADKDSYADATKTVAVLDVKSAEVKIRFRPVVEVYRLIEDMLAESGGVFTEEIEALVEDADHSFEVSADSLCTLVKELEAGEAVLKAEISRLSSLKTSRTKAVASLKSRLEWAMGQRDLETLDSDLHHVVRVRNSQVRTEITADPENLGEEFTEMIPEHLTASIKKIKEWVEARHGYWYEQFKKHTALYLEYLDEVQERLTVEEAAWQKATSDLPVGVKLEQGYHVRIK